jgi:abortive infection bacteriophage resistance protein
LTGKAWSTVKAALERLEKHELAIKTDCGWMLGAHKDVLTIARELEVEKAAKQRCAKHKREREIFLKRLAYKQERLKRKDM